MLKEINVKLNAFELYTIFKDEDHSFILDSGMDYKRLGRYSFISANPFKILKYEDSKLDPFEQLRKELGKYKVENKTGLPFIGGAVGYLGYDLCHYIDKLPKKAVDDINIPDLYFGLYNWVIVIDHYQNKTYLATPNLDLKTEEKIIKNIIKKIKQRELTNIYHKENIKEFSKVTVKSNFSKKDYIKTIEKVRDYIKNGDIYQANLSQRFTAEVSMSSYDLYQKLRNVSPAPFAAFLNFKDHAILSNSPERFIQVRNGMIETRPIKGTRPRGKDPKEDLKLKNELKNSDKDKAELLMIVDLERNDLGRVAEIGTVKVPELFKLEEYANVHHLVATVTGKLRGDKDLIDLIKAVFPGGSITGAPKIRSMEIIDELEPTKRKVYTGSIGYLGFDGSLDLNIAIRTIIKKENKVFFQVGGGITWDSNPVEEYEETLHKGQSIMRALRGYYEQ